MIRGFRDKETLKIFYRAASNKLPPDIQRTAKKKLNMLDAALSLDSLKAPPGNRLAALKGKRAGQFSIRINDKWRICFRWMEGHAHDVEICDYH